MSDLSIGTQNAVLVKTGAGPGSAGQGQNQAGDPQSLNALESTQNQAFEKFNTAKETADAAAAQATAAEEAYWEAQDKFAFGEISAEELNAAAEAMEAAQAEKETADSNLETAASEAQAAADAVEQKKQELRENRKNDTTYVVHCARIECPFGMRESYLALGPTHGVLTHQIPQMTVKDMILNQNIINFVSLRQICYAETIGYSFTASISAGIWITIRQRYTWMRKNCSHRLMNCGTS